MKPILFNTEMVNAILDGRKTATRRIVKTNKHGYLIKPYEVGDVLWVRETWDFLPCVTCGARKDCLEDHPDRMETADGVTEGCFLYRATDGDTPIFGTGHLWRPSIHMPREAARIFLRVTEVHCYPLQESIDAAPVPMQELQQEGVPTYEECKACIKAGNAACVWIMDGRAHPCGLLDQPRWEFTQLWDSMIPKSRLAQDGWAANPEVWVIRFERIEELAVAANDLTRRLALPASEGKARRNGKELSREHGKHWSDRPCAEAKGGEVNPERPRRVAWRVAVPSRCMGNGPGLAVRRAAAGYLPTARVLHRGAVQTA